MKKIIITLFTILILSSCTDKSELVNSNLDISNCNYNIIKYYTVDIDSTKVTTKINSMYPTNIFYFSDIAHGSIYNRVYYIVLPKKGYDINFTKDKK